MAHTMTEKAHRRRQTGYMFRPSLQPQARDRIQHAGLGTKRDCTFFSAGATVADTLR
jgi:hypothetical protein